MVELEKKSVKGKPRKLGRLDSPCRRYDPNRAQDRHSGTTGAVWRKNRGECSKSEQRLTSSPSSDSLQNGGWCGQGNGRGDQMFKM